MNLIELLILIFTILITIIIKCISVIFSNDKRKVATTDAVSKIRRKYYDYVLDVRSYDEWKNGHYLRAIHTPITELEVGAYSKLSGVPKSSHILIYCKTGVRAKQVANILNSIGYSNVEYLDGGIDDLKHLSF